MHYSLSLVLLLIVDALGRVVVTVAALMLMQVGRAFASQTNTCKQARLLTTRTLSDTLTSPKHTRGKHKSKTQIIHHLNIMIKTITETNLHFLIFLYTIE